RSRTPSCRGPSRGTRTGRPVPTTAPTGGRPTDDPRRQAPLGVNGEVALPERGHGVFAGEAPRQRAGVAKVLNPGPVAVVAPGGKGADRSRRHPRDHHPPVRGV